MRKLLELDNKTLRTGRSRSDYMDGGIWNTAQGLNPYIESDSYRGLVAASAAPTDLTGSTVVDVPIAYAKDERGSAYTLYILGDGGHFYSVNVNSVVSDLRSATQINAPVAGMALFQPRAASAPTLLFARSTRIGTWNVTGTYPTGWDDGTYDTGTTTSFRPFHKLSDRLYYGNKQYVGSFTDDGTTTIVHTAQALDLDGKETVTALGDDGRFLVVGASHLATASYNALPSCRILFWDTNSSSWSWEVPLPNESVVRGIKRVGDAVHIICGKGVYVVAYGSSAKQLYTFDSDESIYFDADDLGYSQSVGTWGDGIIFGKLATALSKYLPGADRIVYNPLHGMTGGTSLIIPDFLDKKVFMGTDSSKLYSFNLTTAGTADAFTTRRIPLGDLYHLQRLDIDLPEGIGASDEIDITVHGTDGSQTLATIKQAKYGDKKYLRIPFANVTTSYAWLSITLSAGTPAFAALSLWGETAN